MTIPLSNALSAQLSSTTTDPLAGFISTSRDSKDNTVSIQGGRRTAMAGYSRQSVCDIMTGEDLVRTTGSDYQEIQKRTLTKWVNVQLQVEGDHIDNIETGFKDGRKLLKLLSVVSKEAAPKPEKMNMRIHQLANVAQALSFLEKRLGADSIVDMGNEAIVNGDKKKTLALVFFIMIRYQIQVVLNDYGDDFAHDLLVYSDRHGEGLVTPSTDKGSMVTPISRPPATTTPRKLGGINSMPSDKQHSTSADAKLALLFWVRIQLEDYIVANIIPNIQDFSRSWRNGLAFCLLIHRHKPDLVPDLFSFSHPHLNGDLDLTQKQTWRHLLTLAFDVAAEHMHIPRYLEPDDLMDVDYPHEPSVMMYVAEFYKVMSLVQKNMTPDERYQATRRRRAAVGLEIDGVTPLVSTLSLHDQPLEAEKDDDDGGNTPISITVDTQVNRKKAHRRSTLAEEDKVRIKADLNHRLLMQLTGHLPRGVNPVLDQLLTIHDTLLSFIETNTGVVENVPLAFDSTDAVSEYLAGLQKVEDEMNKKAPLLDTALVAKDTLMLPPENVDETLMMPLTDLQQTQVKNLYDLLVNQWHNFGQQVTTTKCDILRVEGDMANLEENTRRYLMQAAKVMDRIKELQLLVDQVIPRHLDTTKWHPLDPCDNDGHMEKMADAYQKAAEAAHHEIDLFDSTTWKHYRRFLLQFSRVVMAHVETKRQALEQAHQYLMEAKEETLFSSRRFSRALDLISDARAMAIELKALQMDDGVSSASILGWVDQVNAVGARLTATRDTYDDLLAKDERLAAFVNKVQQEYDTLAFWLDQVLRWSIDLERIQKWIGQRIDILHQQQVEAIDPLDDDGLSKVAQEHATQWHDETTKLGRQIDRFGAEDMARWKAQVESLSDNCPARASVLDVTRTTSDSFDQLVHLQRKRSSMVNMLVLRVQWDGLLAVFSEWILGATRDFSELLSGAQTSWCSGDPDGDGLTHGIRALDQALTDLETKMAHFDRTHYSDCLNVYQAMESLHKSTLPLYFGTRQSQLKMEFENLADRLKMARSAVDRYLADKDEPGSLIALLDQLKVVNSNAVGNTLGLGKAAVGNLGPAELSDYIKHLHESIHGLQEDIEGTDSALLSDDRIMCWQKKIDTLDQNHYAVLVGILDGSSSSTCPDGRQQLDQVGQTILDIRNTLAHLYDEVTLSRLCKIYGDNALATQALIEEAQMALHGIEQLYGLLSGGQSDHDSLLAAYQKAELTMDGCREAYNDLCAYNNFIGTQRGDNRVCEGSLLEMAALQDTIDTRWRLLQVQAQSVSGMVTASSVLVDVCGLLETIEEGTHTVESAMKMNTPLTLMDVDSLRRLLDTNTAAYMDDAKSLLAGLKNEHASAFGKRLNQVSEAVSALYSKLDQHKRQLEGDKLLVSLGEDIGRIQAVCQEQLKLIRKQASANPDILGKRFESIQQLILQPYAATLESIGMVFESCKSDFKVVLDQAKNLVDCYGVPSAELELLRHPVDKLIQELDTAIHIEADYLKALKFVIKHGKAEVELARCLSSTKATLLKYSKKDVRAQLYPASDFVEMYRLGQDSETSVQLFLSTGQDFKKAKLHSGVGVARASSINKAVDRCQKSIKLLWAEIKKLMKDAKPLLDEMHRRQHGAVKLNEALLYVDDIKDRINALQPFGTNVILEDDKLKELDKEIKITLAKKLQDMDTLLESIPDSDGMIRKQRAQLSTTTDQLHHLLQTRQKQAQTEGNIVLFLGIIDQVDERVLQILVEVENTAPHHANIIEGKYVKSDLQELLSRLVGVYKKNGPLINKLLGSAKQEARKQFLDNNDRVTKRMKKTIDRWTKAQLAAAEREKELHACINAVDHEFFTKLAATKKKTPSPNRRSSHPSDHPSDRRSSTPGTDSSSSPSSSTSLNGLPQPLAYTTTRRTSLQLSTVLQERRLAAATSNKRPKTPTSIYGKPRTTYVSDPKNELDVQFGRIVNNSALKVNIKIVSDEVGKYYFGERLVYCRILPSKMVMVRVGGGWVELSHFLKDHGYTDNQSGKSKSNNNNNNKNDIDGIDQQERQPSVRNMSPSHQLNVHDRSTLGSSNSNHHLANKPSNQQPATPKGYVDGDNFIHVGEDGSKIVMKLAKAVDQLP